MSETQRVKERYARRESGADALWQGLEPAVLLPLQEKERALARWLKESPFRAADEVRLLDVGCGNGDDLLGLIRLGFRPEHLKGVELLEERAAAARHRLPAAVEVVEGDASTLPFDDASFDVVMQSTVFTSLLDDDFQARLAGEMWRVTRPGGGILWIDFVYDNPRNADVRGVPRSRVEELFPAGKARTWRVGLAPPIARRVTRLHPALYGVANALPLLRTHIVCWIEKR